MKKVNISNQKGFTLIELLVVISIIGLLSSVVLASLRSARDKGQVAAGRTFDSHTYQAFAADAYIIYDFDDGTIPITDKSGNGSTMNCSIPPSVFSTSGELIKGNALQFTANNQNCTGSIAQKNFDNSKGAISFWIQPRTAFVTGSSLVAHVRGLWINVDGGKVNLTGVATLSSLASLPLGSWSHVLISWNSGVSKMYINGKSDATGGPIGFNSDTMHLGGWGFDAFEGLLDQFAIYTQSIN